MRRFLLPLLLLSLLLVACATRQDVPPVEALPPAPQPEPIPAPEPEPEPPPLPDPREAAVEALADSMSLEEKVGQLFFSACPAQGAAEKLAQFHLGGYLLFLPDFKDPDGNWLTAEAFMDKTASFQDAAAISGYAQNAVAWAVSQGILNCYNYGTLNHVGDTTRDQAATIFMHFAQ